jgi:hypothetical protein
METIHRYVPPLKFRHHCLILSKLGPIQNVLANHVNVIFGSIGSQSVMWRLIGTIIPCYFRIAANSWIMHGFHPPLNFNGRRLSLSKLRPIQNAVL